MGQILSFLPSCYGKPLDTDIINVLSKNDLPENVIPGTIAIISEVSANNVYKQSEEPASPINGDLWMITSTKAKIIYVQNGAPYRIDTVKQYINNEWILTVSYQYIDNKWSNELYILKAGDLCPDVTGGWTNNANQGIIVENGLVRLYNTSGSESADYVASETINAINLSDFNTLYFNVTSATWTSGATSARNVCYLYVIDKSSGDTVIVVNYKVQATGLHTLDISNLSGDYYIRFNLYSYHGDVIRVYSDGLWLE